MTSPVKAYGRSGRFPKAMLHKIRTPHLVLGAVLAVLIPGHAEDNWDTLLSQVNELVERGQVAQAMATLRLACPEGLVLTPPSRMSQCLQSEGILRAIEGQYEEAIRSYEAAETQWVLIGQDLPNHRQDHAALAYNLGVLYIQIGRHREAAKRLEQAAAIHESVSGPNSVLTIRILGLWGSELITLGMQKDAERVLTRALDLARSNAPSGSADHAQILMRIGMLRANQGDLQTALRLGQQSEQMARTHLSASGDAYADIVMGLASLYRRAGDTARAEPLLKKGIHVLGQSGRRTSILRLFTAHRELGCLRAAAGMNSLAEEEFRQALRLARRHFADGSFEVALAEADLGQLLYVTSKRFAEAEELLRHSLAVTEALLGPSHTEVGIAHANLGLLYDRWRRNAQAALHYKFALQLLPNSRELKRRYSALEKHLSPADHAVN